MGCRFGTAPHGEAAHDAMGQLLAAIDPVLAAAVPTPRSLPSVTSFYVAFTLL